MQTYFADICVIGAGSGGIGAAIAASRKGASVILVEKKHIPGGTVTMSWVHTWEPVCGSSAICERLWEKMKKYPNGTSSIDYTVAKCRINPDTGKRNPTLAFEVWAYLNALYDEFYESGIDKIFYNTSFVASIKNNRKIKKIICSSINGDFAIEAKYFIDCTADIFLAREAGCAVSLGADAKSDYDEPHAPESQNKRELNGANWIYRVRPTGSKVEVENSEVPLEARINRFFGPEMPNGDILVNICGSGIIPMDCPEEWNNLFFEQRKLAWDSYRWQIISGNHPDWQFVGFAPEIGIREGYRLRARYVVTENDIIQGVSESQREKYAAICDHRLDIHGANFSRELDKPFGVPIESLMANEYDNLLVACRGAGFSHIAAGSCRLARTMMTIGESAGNFAFMML